VTGRLELRRAVTAQQKAWRVVEAWRIDAECLGDSHVGSASGGVKPLGGFSEADAL
jgi:hypothetical protein